MGKVRNRILKEDIGCMRRIVCVCVCVCMCVCVCVCVCVPNAGETPKRTGGPDYLAILMMEEKAFADFIITGVLIFSFGGYYLYKMCMMKKLHKKYLNTTVNVRFSLFGKIWEHTCYA